MDSTLVRSDSQLATTSETRVIQSEEQSLPPVAGPVLKLRLKKPKADKKVVWHENTVDNEGMGKKKSKCCCIYKKPTVFGESSSESDDECEHCFGHPEKRSKNKKPDSNHDLNGGCPGDACQLSINKPQDQINDAPGGSEANPNTVSETPAPSCSHGTLT